MVRGIALGCPLSPLLGALYLKGLDDRLADLSVFYARFMDDWVILAPTRRRLRQGIKVVNQTLNELRVEKHPDKTFIGRPEKRFDFLGYHFQKTTEYTHLTLSAKSLTRFGERMTRLDEQDADLDRIGQFVMHGLRWVTAGLDLAPNP